MTKRLLDYKELLLKEQDKYKTDKLDEQVIGLEQELNRVVGERNTIQQSYINYTEEIEKVNEALGLLDKLQGEL